MPQSEKKFTLSSISAMQVNELYSHIYKFNEYNAPIRSGALMFRSIAYGAFIDSKLFGGISGTRLWGNVANIEMLYVDENYRELKVGSSLIDVFVQAVKSHGGYKIQVDTFDFQALEFYKKNSFTVFGQLNDCPNPSNIRYYLERSV